MINYLGKYISKLPLFTIQVIFLAAFFLQGPLEAKPLKCDVPAPSAILIDVDTGLILYEKNAHTPRHIASTTKVATLLYAIAKKGSSPNVQIKASQEAVGTVPISARRNSGKHPSYRLEYGGTHMGIYVGEILPFHTLLHGLMLQSANDAANVIAEYVSGSVPQFVKELNQYLKEIGCKNTSFTNPHGLTDPQHTSTAYDLALIASTGLKYPLYRDIVKSLNYPRVQTNKQPESQLTQFNALLKPKHKMFYPYAIGIKTGYTDAAGHNLVAAAEKDGRRLVAVVLNCDDINKKYKAAIALFEAAFNEKKVQRKLFAKNFDSFTRPLSGAKIPLEAIFQQDVFVQYYPSEESEFKAVLHWDNVALPINEGQKVGEVQVRDARGQLFISEPLYAKKEILPTLAYQTSQVCAGAMDVVQEKKHWLGLVLGAVFLGLAFFLKRIPFRRKSS